MPARSQFVQCAFYNSWCHRVPGARSVPYAILNRCQ